MRKEHPVEMTSAAGTNITEARQLDTDAIQRLCNPKAVQCFAHPNHGSLCMGCVIEMMKEERRAALLQAANVIEREYAGLKLVAGIVKTLRQRAEDELVWVGPDSPEAGEPVGKENTK